MLKKIFVLFLVVVILLLNLSCNIYAANYYYNNVWNSHNEHIKLFFNDKFINTDVPPLIFEERTLVPVRTFFETVGAEVLWDGDKKEVIVRNSNFTIKLIIDSNVAYVNSEAIKLDVPAKIIADTNYTSRTMVPIRFISEKLGYTVKWDSKTYSVYVYESSYISTQNLSKITAISSFSTEKKDTVKIKTTLPAKPVVTQMSNPDRIVIDFYNYGASIQDGISGVSGVNFNKIRFAEHEGYSRVVIDLVDDSYTYETNISDEYFAVIIRDATYNNDASDDFEENNKTDADIQPKPEDSQDKPTISDDVLVVIDPGHGGSDPGAIGYKNGKEYLYESTVNLDISLKLYEILKSKGINVAMTRMTDEYVGLKERAEYANNLNASLFICIHNNSAVTAAAHGSMVYYFTSDQDSETKRLYGITSKELAAIIHDEILLAGGRYDRKIADGSKFVVLYSTTMPAILTECAFLSNDEERELLNSEEFRQKLAKGISKGVITALKQMGKI